MLYLLPSWSNPSRDAKSLHFCVFEVTTTDNAVFNLEVFRFSTKGDEMRRKRWIPPGPGYCLIFFFNLQRQNRDFWGWSEKNRPYFYFNFIYLPFVSPWALIFFQQPYFRLRSWCSWLSCYSCILLCHLWPSNQTSLLLFTSFCGVKPSLHQLARVAHSPQKKHRMQTSKLAVTLLAFERIRRHRFNFLLVALRFLRTSKIFCRM